MTLAFGGPFDGEELPDFFHAKWVDLPVAKLGPIIFGESAAVPSWDESSVGQIEVARYDLKTGAYMGSRNIG